MNTSSVNEKKSFYLVVLSIVPPRSVPEQRCVPVLQLPAGCAVPLADDQQCQLQCTANERAEDSASLP